MKAQKKKKPIAHFFCLHNTTNSSKKQMGGITWTILVNSLFLGIIGML
mgnify:CR=1 FL=1